MTVLVFFGSLALTLAAAGFFADRLDHVGSRLGLPEAVVGLLTALAADAPELSAAVVSLIHGNKSVSMGVVLGSNVFNLAAMVGLSALVAGAVTIDRRSLAVEGTVGLLATTLAGAVVLVALPAPVALAGFALVACAYLVFTLRAREHMPRSHRVATGAVWTHVTLLVPAVVLIVVGATGMVHAALELAGRWHVSNAVVGTIVLAVLTSIPNAFTAVRLGWAGRGSALVSETLNSNTINLVGGVIVPALVVGLASNSSLSKANFAWVIAMTAVTLAFLVPRGGMRRGGGMVLVAFYAAFVVVQLS